MSAVSPVKVALAQINATVGDLAGNTRKIVDSARRAYDEGARLVLTPELGLCGYPPEDLLLRPAFMRACAEALADCARQLADLPGLFVVVGHPHQLGSSGDVRSKSVSVQLRFNAASVLSEGRVVGTYCKRELPNYQVFDERRYFASGRDGNTPALVFSVGDLCFGVVICEDAWFDEPAELARAAGAQVLCVINASPFHLGKMVEREDRMAVRARAVAMPLLYAHLAGGQDEVVFDGASFALDARGVVGARAKMFDETSRSSTSPRRRSAARSPRSRASRRRRGRRSSSACATTSARTAFRASSSACRAASTRRWCWRSPSTRSAPTASAPS